jgi:hypothetical protein
MVNSTGFAGLPRSLPSAIVSQLPWQLPHPSLRSRPLPDSQSGAFSSLISSFRSFQTPTVFVGVSLSSFTPLGRS